MEKWNDEVIFNLNYYKSLIDEETKEIELEEFTRDIGSGNPMWCRENQEFIEKGEDCGKDCRYYNPCNGKSGRCRELQNGFKNTGRKFILTKNGLKEDK
jgi:hypothetical protein